jgi:hypothetical protein
MHREHERAGAVTRPLLPFGKVKLWIDTESWTGSFNREFSWKGEVLNTYHVDGYLNHAGSLPDGSGSEWFWSVAACLAVRRGARAEPRTLAGLRMDCRFRKAAG